MRFTFTEKRVEIDNALRAYAEKKISKLDRFFRTESDAYVTFSTERFRYIAEVTINNNGMFYRVSESTGDMYASIDSAVASIERQIRKNKTRLEKRLREGAFERDAKPDAYDPAMEVEDTDFSVVRTKKFAIKPMSTEEAILQMNLLEHEFFVFKDIETGETCAVYKRIDGDYGLIVPEKA